MSEVSATYDWHDGDLVLLEDCDLFATRLETVDSFLVSDARVLAVELHRQRFVSSARERGFSDSAQLESFWSAAVAIIPREGSWFPRFEATSHDGAFRLRFRLRTAPELQDSITLATHRGADPRQAPTVKGPDLDAMLRLRQEAQRSGAHESVILDKGLVSEGSTTSLMWWRGDQLMVPPSELPRVASVTARSILTVAAAIGVPIGEEALTPDELEGREVWAVNSLHGIRLVTAWVEGPAVAAEPGRLAAWRTRLSALARPLG